MEKIVVINGIEYERIETEKPKKSNAMSKTLATILAMSATMPYYDYYSTGGSNYSRSLPEDIDIVKEFELIQLKKSKLSRWERDKVVSIFNKHFKIVTPAPPSTTPNTSEDSKPQTP